MRMRSHLAVGPRPFLHALVGIIVLTAGSTFPAAAAASTEPQVPARVELWEARYNGSASGWDDAVALVAGPEGSMVFVTGPSTGEGTGRDYATVAYNADNGNELWVARYDGPQPHVPQQFGSGWDESSAIGVSPDGTAVYVTGSSSGIDTGRDYATIAYDAETDTCRCPGDQTLRFLSECRRTQRRIYQAPAAACRYSSRP